MIVLAGIARMSYQGSSGGAKLGASALGHGFAWAREDGWTLQQHLLPDMDMVRGHLPLKFALSKRRCVFEERDVDACYPLASGGIHHFLDDHLPHEGNRNAFYAMHHLIRAPDGGPLEKGTILSIHRRGMLAGFWDELLESQRDKVGYPMLQAFDRFRRRLCGPAFKLAADV